MKVMKWFSAAVLLLSIGILPYAQEGASGGAYIREITGTVEVKASGAAAWTTAQIGERLEKETMISTGFKSTAIITLGNSTLTMRPLTRLSFDELRNTQGQELVDLYLQTGRVRADVSPPTGGKTDFTVRSPVATASVRGTSFEFNGENLTVDQGKVHITGGDRSAVYVGAGRQVFSDPETGKTMGAAETAMAEMTPILPAAAATSTPETASVSPSSVSPSPSSVDTGFGVEWRTRE
jgi:hypothetical protein